MPITLPFFCLLVLLILSGGCSSEQPSECRKCHRGLEQTSPAHGDCISCHGGDKQAPEKEEAHRKMYGDGKPGNPECWEDTCGRCHPYQLKRVRSALMTTNTGMIYNIQSTWGSEDDGLYAVRSEEVFDGSGEPRTLAPVAELGGLAGELYRKFCSLCHVGRETNRVWAGSHGSGCATCHFPYSDNATYQGGDKTVKGEWPYSETHRLEALPEDEVCRRCHNRSGRIALTYQGLSDSNDGLVPTREGMPGPRLLGGLRDATAISPDIHHAKGMDCIDCHTSRDIMGDGYAYRNLYQQTEIKCEDCHGSPGEKPRHQEIKRENAEPVRESGNYQRRAERGDKMVLTSKGRPYSNVFFEEGEVRVIGKRDGKSHKSKVITDTPEHTIDGHERLECYACHSRAVPQCYGCHTKYDQTEMGRDYIKGRETPGAFSETEDYRRLYPFPLALNQRGKISPVTPGCQTFVTVIGPDGKKRLDEHVFPYKDGGPRLRFAPFYSHNTAEKAVGCRECHANPDFLGFGQHVVEKDSIQATLICEQSEEKPLDGFLTMKEGRVKAFSAITREHSRPLTGGEIKKIMKVNLCLVCHDDGEDPIYQKELDYNALDDCLDRPPAADH